MPIILLIKVCLTIVFNALVAGIRVAGKREVLQLS
jgi:hypothetical protein